MGVATLRESVSERLRHDSEIATPFEWHSYWAMTGVDASAMLL